MLQLPRKGRLLTQPAQVLGGGGAVLDKLRNQHTRHMVVELVTGVIVLMRAVGYGKLCIICKALCDLAPVQKAVVGGGVGNALLPGVHRAVPPAAGDQIQQHRMGLDIRAVHQPVIIGTVGQHIGQLLRHKCCRVGQRRDVAGSLQVIEGCVIVDTVGACIAKRRQSRYTGVVVFLTAADHFAEAVVRPDLNDILRQLQKAILVQLHRLAVEIRAADSIGVVGPDQIVLLLY